MFYKILIYSYTGQRVALEQKVIAQKHIVTSKNEKEEKTALDCVSNFKYRRASLSQSQRG